ncbi:D-alanyl-D-alanine carboxypeptidase family protein [Tuberibacillus sp. Marseille-P3662]|uniref:D-alanyl-D-alanine carboxypeptidase family protein n=1 Tax=Tuberibacillus sp. Marseille-P3662 TaxID=1965358 RepID=UPI000A1CA81C|nr:D-alanyl-D-alanine carboxypeptidase family protein [Tuberibacillus sp. Marseille-P3662]
MFKKITQLCLVGAFICAIVFGFNPKSFNLDSLINTDSHQPGLNINAKSAVLMNNDNGKFIYTKHSNQSYPPASLSKIMSEYLVLKAIHEHDIDWQTQVPISRYAYWVSSHPDFSSVPLKKGQTYTVRQLYQAMAIHSANGATVALAEKVAGSEKQFVKRMNQTADEMGLEQTQFVNSTGLSNQDLERFYSTGSPNASNVMSTQDIAVLAHHLIQSYPEALNISQKTVAVMQQSGESIQYHNTNLMLPDRGIEKLAYHGLDGLKTGYTKQAGYCFVGTVERHGQRVISVVIGTDTKTARFTETKKLLNYGFNKVNE